MAVRIAQCGICEHFHECLGVSEFGLPICYNFKDKNFTVDSPLEWTKFTPQMEKNLEELSLTKRLYKMTTREKIEVMQAYLDGKTIENKEGDEWCENHYPQWNWHDTTYRIKPEPKYRPYNSIEEFLQASKEHGLWMHHTQKYYNCNIIPDEVVGDGIMFANDHRYNWDLVLKCFIWCDDNTPCGIKEQ